MNDNCLQVAPSTVHPAFEKAAGYFDLRVVHVPIDSSYRLRIDEYKRVTLSYCQSVTLASSLRPQSQAITENTILLVASATEYCYGMVDPIEEVSGIALERGLPLHVDSCIGGFMLPWSVYYYIIIVAVA